MIPPFASLGLPALYRREHILENSHDKDGRARTGVRQLWVCGPSLKQALRQEATMRYTVFTLVVMIACVSRAQDPPVDTARVSALAVPLARELAKHSDELDLSGLVEISEAAAVALSRYEGTLLDLSGLTKLSPQVAEAFAQSNASALDISGVTSITPQIAKKLAQYQGMLFLWGVSELPGEAAAALGDSKSELLVLGLTTLPDTTAAALARFKGKLAIWTLPSISDSAAEKLMRGERPALDLWDVEEISAKAASFLAMQKGTLTLGLTSLPDDVANELAKHEGELVLDSLASITEASTEALARHKGVVTLGGRSGPVLTVEGQGPQNDKGGNQNRLLAPGAPRLPWNLGYFSWKASKKFWEKKFRDLGLPEYTFSGHGVLVTKVSELAKDKNGIQVHDLIFRVDGKTFDSDETLNRITNSLKVGQPVEVAIRRSEGAGQTRTWKTHRLTVVTLDYRKSKVFTSLQALQNLSASAIPCSSKQYSESAASALEYCCTKIADERRVPVAIAAVRDEDGRLRHLKQVLEAGVDCRQVMKALADFSDAQLSVMVELATETEWGKWLDDKKGERLTNGQALEAAYQIWFSELGHAAKERHVPGVIATGAVAIAKNAWKTLDNKSVVGTPIRSTYSTEAQETVYVFTTSVNGVEQQFSVPTSDFDSAVRQDINDAIAAAANASKKLAADQKEEADRRARQEAHRLKAEAERVRQERAYRLPEGTSTTGAKIDEWNAEQAAEIQAKGLRLTHSQKRELSEGLEAFGLIRHAYVQGDMQSVREMLDMGDRTGLNASVQSAINSSSLTNIIIPLNDGRALYARDLWKEILKARFKR